MRIKTVLTKAAEYACISQTALFSSPSLPQAQGARPSAGLIVVAQWNWFLRTLFYLVNNEIQEVTPLSEHCYFISNNGSNGWVTQCEVFVAAFLCKPQKRHPAPF